PAVPTHAASIACRGCCTTTGWPDGVSRIAWLRRHDTSSRTGKSERTWHPRDSVRDAAAARSARATSVSAASSTLRRVHGSDSPSCGSCARSRTEPATARPSASRPIPAYLLITRCSWSRSTIGPRSEEHTSELQSRENLVCRLLLEKKKKHKHKG